MASLYTWEMRHRNSNSPPATATAWDRARHWARLLLGILLQPCSALTVSSPYFQAGIASAVRKGTELTKSPGGSDLFVLLCTNSGAVAAAAMNLMLHLLNKSNHIKLHYKLLFHESVCLPDHSES